MGQITVGSKTFKSKGEATEYTKQILNSSKHGSPLTGDYHDHMSGLIVLHPRAAEKIGCGIESFTVNRDYMGKQCFYIHRVDGSKDSFSYPTCIKGKEESPDSVAKRALRKAVEFHNWAFRDSELNKGHVVCPFTGETISRQNYHVDHHDPKFKDLIAMWLEANGLKLSDIKIGESDGRDMREFMSDIHQMLSWQTFHITRAKRRLLSPKGNLVHARQ